MAMSSLSKAFSKLDSVTIILSIANMEDIKATILKWLITASYIDADTFQGKLCS